MTRDLALLFGLVISGAAWLFAHILLWARVLRSRRVPARERWLAGVPPLLPWVAWRARAHTGTLVWVVLGLLYAALRALA